LPIHRRNITGVDIGSAAVKLVHCTGPKNWKAGMAMLPEGVMAGNQINSTKLLTAALKKALTAAKIGRGKAALCLSGTDIIIRHSVLPRMSAEQLRQNVIDEISGYLAVDPALYTIDYKVQDVITDGAAVQYKVMIVAVPRSILGPYMQALSAAGLKVMSIDVAANAKEKLLNHLTGRKGNYAVIDLDMSASTIDTFQNGRFFVSKTSASGLDSAATALAKALGTDPLRAQEMILLMDPNPACRQAVSDYLDQVVGDALRVTDYFRSRNQMTPVEQVFICGAGTRIPGIVQMIQDRLNLPVRDICGLLSPVLGGRGETGPRMSAYAAAAGATLLEVDQ
jgi:type IV pilus assembly protein PilM